MAGAGEVNAWAVEKWGRTLSAGATERRMMKGGRTTADVHFERNWLGRAGQRGKGGRRGRIHMEVGEGGRGGLAQRSVARGGRQRPPVCGHGRRRCFTNRRGRQGTDDVVRARLTGGAARQWALTSGPSSTVPAGSVLNSVLNRFKHIQTVPKKFEFLQTLAGYTFPRSKNLK
jgi:hypothetical protein